ncbi:MAG: hemolysin secretion protein D, partial [Planctomycetaceae bacterium]
MIVKVGELPAFNAIGTPTSVERAATPSIARHVGRWLRVMFLLLPAALAFVPWQQTVRARGQVTAYAPTERKQTITARVSGQIGRWRVVEG